MAATSAARATLTFLLAFTVVVSVVAAPVAATGDDLTYADDDDPIDVDGENDSVSVESGADSVTVGTDGIDTDTDDTTDSTDDVESGSTDDITDGVSTTQDEQGEELPYNYSDLPLSLIPVDLCQRPPGVPELPAEPPVENPAPVDPTNPPSAPVTQCGVFNPYDPPFDPTDLPDNPGVDYDIYQADIGPDGANILVSANGDFDNYPSGFTIVGIEASENSVDVVQYTYGDDGDREILAFSNIEHEPGTEKGSVETDTIAIGKSSGANIDCTGEACTLQQGTAPVGDQTVPTNRSGGGGGDSPEAPVDIPCQAPVDPGSLPESPVDPSNPPEPLPPIGAPVNPTNPPSSPVRPCELYDPNDPPSTSPNPDGGYGIHEVGTDAVVVGGNAWYNRSTGPGGYSTVVVSQRGNDTTIAQYSRGKDGQKPFSKFVIADVNRDSVTRIGIDGYQFEGRTLVVLKGLGQTGRANVTCDGEFCYVGQNGAPIGEQKFRIATEDADKDESLGESATGSTDARSTQSSSSADDPTSDDSSTDASSGSTSDATTATTDSGGSTIAATAPAGSTTAAAPAIPTAFENGIPDAASAAEALMDMV